MCEVDTQRLGHQPKQLPVAVEAPRPPLLDYLQARFVVAVEDLTAQLATRAAVGEFQRVGPEPAHTHYRDQAIGQDATHGGGRLQVFQLHAGDGIRLPHDVRSAVVSTDRRRRPRVRRVANPYSSPRL